MNTIVHETMITCQQEFNNLTRCLTKNINDNSVSRVLSRLYTMITDLNNIRMDESYFVHDDLYNSSFIGNVYITDDIAHCYNIWVSYGKQRIDPVIWITGIDERFNEYIGMTNYIAVPIHHPSDYKILTNDYYHNKFNPYSKTYDSDITITDELINSINVFINKNIDILDMINNTERSIDCPDFK